MLLLFNLRYKINGFQSLQNHVFMVSSPPLPSTPPSPQDFNLHPLSTLSNISPQTQNSSSIILALSPHHHVQLSPPLLPSPWHSMNADKRWQLLKTSDIYENCFWIFFPYFSYLIHSRKKKRVTNGLKLKYFVVGEKCWDFQVGKWKLYEFVESLEQTLIFVYLILILLV